MCVFDIRERMHRGITPFECKTMVRHHPGRVYEGDPARLSSQYHIQEAAWHSRRCVAHYTSPGRRDSALAAVHVSNLLLAARGLLPLMIARLHTSLYRLQSCIPVVSVAILCEAYVQERQRRELHIHVRDDITNLSGMCIETCQGC